MTLPSYDPDEEARLLEQLRQIQEAKEKRKKYEDDWHEAIRLDQQFEEEKRKKNLTITISDFEIVLDRLLFKVSEFRDDVNNVLRYHKTTKYDYNLGRWTVEVPHWVSLFEELKNLPNVSINYGESTEKDLNEWKEPHYYHVKQDNRGIIINLGPKANYYLLRDIPGYSWIQEKKQVRIPFSEGWRLPAKFNEQPGVYYEPDVHEFISKQLHLRAKLDEIATRTVPENEFVLNGNKLYDFQAVSVEYGQAVESAGGHGIIIGHEMGLGKTPISIAIAEWLCDNNLAKKILIVVPANLVPNWFRQLRKFTNHIPFQIYGEKPNDFALAQIIAGDHRYYIASYDSISTVTKVPEAWTVNDEGVKKRIPAHNRFLWIEAINLGRFDACLIDEAHYIKNVGSNRSQAIRDLKIPRFYPITGTPLLNRPGELWPLMWLIDKEATGPYETFMTNYTIDGKSPRNVEALREVLKPMMIRKVKKDVLKELPPINRIVREYELSKKARDQYQAVLDGLWDDVKRWDGSSQNTQVIQSILAKLMKMKQVCAWDKVEYGTDLATELYDQGTDYHKVILFSQFVNTPDVVYEIQRRLSPECLVVSGNDDVYQRMKYVDQFQNDPNIHFLSAGLKAAREGMDITAAGSAIFMDLDWTPGNHHQAEGRAYGRMSDLHTISSYYIITQNTIEEDIWELLGFKQNIFDAVVEGAEASRDASVAMELIRRLKERM